MTNTKRYYAAENAYGTDCSHGFANTWGVIVFNSKAARDLFVDESRNITVSALLRKDVPSVLNSMDRPRPFSTEYWGIVAWSDDDLLIPGFVGRIENCDAITWPRLY